ncbi:hypothetical protein GQ55_9G001600 [Panicum hallii var. hallii]|uniref:Uncharacterized protein n=1 Tax=Panicum hallii var. hallii TaxID=1504633 RepID=A0A2T7BXY8_9POAL|nr:hypothetical protein GQ55_9G001600 [Panicum hallii var. hallii]
MSRALRFPRASSSPPRGSGRGFPFSPPSGVAGESTQGKEGASPPPLLLHPGVVVPPPSRRLRPGAAAPPHPPRRRRPSASAPRHRRPASPSTAAPAQRHLDLGRALCIHTAPPPRLPRRHMTTTFAPLQLQQRKVLLQPPSLWSLKGFQQVTISI